MMNSYNSVPTDPTQSFQENSKLLIKKRMEDLSVDEVKDYISLNKLLDKVH